MIWYLNKKVILLPPKMGTLQFGDYIKSGEHSPVILVCLISLISVISVCGCILRKKMNHK